jgi:hypothetical protein
MPVHTCFFVEVATVTAKTENPTNARGGLTGLNRLLNMPEFLKPLSDNINIPC